MIQDNYISKIEGGDTSWLRIGAYNNMACIEVSGEDGWDRQYSYAEIHLNVEEVEWMIGKLEQFVAEIKEN